MKRTVASVSVWVLLAATSAWATETQLWVSDSPADYSKSQTSGVLVGPDGVLQLGPRARSSTTDSLDVIWSIAPLPSGAMALGGDEGRIDRWTESGGIRPWVKLPVGQVLSLAQDGDGLVAGTGPDGLIYHISARGDTTRLAKTGERYVWGLAPAGKGAWYAATGTHGKLMRVEGSRTRVVIDSDESNLVSLVSDGHGGAFAGGDSHGRILWARADGTVTTVFDATEDEIRALALAPDGTLYAAGLSASATSEEEDTERRVEPAKSAVASARATVYRIVPDKSAAAVFTPPHPFVFALAANSAGVWVATGNRGAVFQLDDQARPTQVLAVPQGQVTALSLSNGGRLVAATSNPGSLWRLGPEKADKGELLSSPLDARRFAQFGRIAWHGDAGGGKVSLSTRSGNTDPPDTTWSAWKAAPQESRITSPAARYLQWKVELAGGHPRVDAVEVAWRERNLPPKVEDVTVAPQGTGFREGELQPRTDPVTQTLPGGQRVEYQMQGTGPRALRELPAWARGLRTLQWKATDPNGDPMTYHVDMRAEGSDHWTEIGDKLDATSFTWDTQGLPDGRYRIRVQATDEPGNSVGEALTSEALSEPFTIDNTPPVVTSLEAKGQAGAKGELGAIAVSGRASDQESMLVRLEIELDDGDWRMVTPTGGFADSRDLDFSVKLPNVKAGEHSVAVRAVDRAGNGATRAARVTVPASR
jgi:hypothetical protein